MPFASHNRLSHSLSSLRSHQDLICISIHYDYDYCTAVTATTKGNTNNTETLKSIPLKVRVFVMLSCCILWDCEIHKLRSAFSTVAVSQSQPFGEIKITNYFVTVHAHCGLFMSLYFSLYLSWRRMPSSMCCLPTLGGCGITSIGTTLVLVTPWHPVILTVEDSKIMTLRKKSFGIRKYEYHEGEYETGVGGAGAVVRCAEGES